MSIANIVWVDIVVASIAGFGVGGIWFGPKTFYPMWIKAMNYKEGEGPLSQYGMGVVFGSTYIMVLVQTFGLAALMNLAVKAGVATDYGPLHGAALGAFVGIFIAAASSLTHRLFGGQSFKVWAIEVSGDIAILTVIGAILGALN